MCYKKKSRSKPSGTIMVLLLSTNCPITSPDRIVLYPHILYGLSLHTLLYYAHIHTPVPLTHYNVFIISLTMNGGEPFLLFIRLLQFAILSAFNGRRSVKRQKTSSAFVVFLLIFFFFLFRIPFFLFVLSVIFICSLGLSIRNRPAPEWGKRGFGLM